MNKKNTINFITAISLSCFIYTGCIDDKYDMNKDIDMTMGFGSDGLALKIGSSSKTYLKDILKVDDSDMLQTMSAGTPMYYLIKDGSAHTSMNVQSINQFKIDDFVLKTKSILVSATGLQSGKLPVDIILPEWNVEGSEGMSFTINNIPDEVKSISKISFDNVFINITYDVYRNGISKWEGFELESSKLKFIFPEYIHLKTEGTQKNVFTTTNKQSVIIPVEYIELPADKGAYGKLVKDGKIVMESSEVKIEGSISPKLLKGTTFTSGDNANLNLKISISPITPTSISGQVDPQINPEVEPINLSSDLPDFLQDDAVKLNIVNPTFKINIDGTSLPVDVNFSADITGYNKVSFPSVKISKKKDTQLYYYQGTSPFDPDDVNPLATKINVPDLNTLITKIPDQIAIDMKNGKITTDKSSIHSIDLPLQCNLGIDYKVLIPFKFGKDLCVVYNDSIDDMAKDLKNYDAQGAEITADVENTIPLNLKVELSAYDESDKLIPSSELTIYDGLIDAAAVDGNSKVSKLTLNIESKTKGVISRLNKIKFKVTANSKVEEEGILSSDQYIELKDIRLRLKGKVTGNLN